MNSIVLLALLGICKASTIGNPDYEYSYDYNSILSTTQAPQEEVKPIQDEAKPIKDKVKPIKNLYIFPHWLLNLFYPVPFIPVGTITKAVIGPVILDAGR
jgi:hypothetical protein